MLSFSIYEHVCALTHMWMHVGRIGSQNGLQYRAELKRQGFDENRIKTERMLNMRFEGTDTALMVLPSQQDGDGQEDFEAAFKRVYKSEFGFLLETKTITVDDVKVSGHSRSSVALPLISPRPGSWHWKDL
jgi:N-methylhydantoinase A/oxoprolinase/acetone carboxylase beta subunit